MIKYFQDTIFVLDSSFKCTECYGGLSPLSRYANPKPNKLKAQKEEDRSIQ